MEKIWEAIKRFFGWKPKVKIVKNPINNFTEWTSFEQSIATGINLVREENKPLSMIDRMLGKNNIPDLTPEKVLYEEAVKRCEVQFDREKISHDGVGKAFIAMSNAGFEGHAEILAYGYSSPNSVVDAWFRSDSHKRIMLKSSHKFYGVAMREHNNRKYYCVLFAR